MSAARAAASSAAAAVGRVPKRATFYQDTDMVTDAAAFHQTVSLLRSFFTNRGFVETHTQSRLSILAACEDPTTIQTYNYAGKLWPLPQTGQMWLEYELLNKPEVPGYFTLSTSYRAEPNPIPGRHKTIFPMFEFESHGTYADLKEMERDLIAHLGLMERDQIPEKTYGELSKVYGTDDLTSKEEAQMREDYGPALLLTDFPIFTSPFWNMKMDLETGISNKVDVIIEGQETIGSAERSCDVETMNKTFHTISDGQYAQLLFDKFGKDRILYELDSFLSQKFFPRYGGGIGVTRMVRALQLNNLIDAKSN